MSKVAILALEDGQIFHGKSIGSADCAVGEVVFNTAMTGYQEILTDPSYARQMVTLTYPHIGNTGVNAEDEECEQIYAAGLIVRDLPNLYSNWRADMGLNEYLVAHNVTAISDIDTRALTRYLRINGAKKGCIMSGNISTSAAIKQAQNFTGLKNVDLAKVVSTPDTYSINAKDSKFKVVVYDFGVKQNILNLLADNGCDLTVVNAEMPADEVLKMQPDGVFLSNGPGDPEPCDYATDNIKVLLDADMPMFGICLGHQLLSLANGARTEKMKFGHHGANHPVQDLASKKVMISSQNHGFMVSESDFPAHLKITHRSLFDGSIQGIKVAGKPAFSFQGHPEASPGPHDLSDLFLNFIKEMDR